MSKRKVVRSLRYSGYLTNTSCVCQVAGISKRSNDKQKSFFLKKSTCYYLFETLKNKKSDFLIFWIVTCASARHYTVFISFQTDNLPERICQKYRDIFTVIIWYCCIILYNIKLRLLLSWSLFTKVRREYWGWTYTWKYWN